MKNTDGEPRRGDSCTADAFQLPADRPIKVDGLEEKFFILPEEFETTALLRMAKKPQLGEQRITLILKMQACSERACFASEDVSIELPIGVVKKFDRGRPVLKTWQKWGIIQ